MVSQRVECPLCGCIYVPGGPECQARGCPLSLGGCRVLHCPRCGHTIPDERASVLARWIRGLFGAEPSTNPRPLSRCRAGDRGVVDRLEGDPELVAALTAHGVTVGAPMDVVQRFPAFVVEIGHTTLSLDRRGAEAVWLREPG